MRRHRQPAAAYLLPLLIGSPGCWASHSLSDSDAPPPELARSDGGRADGSPWSGFDERGTIPQICLPQSALTIRLGPERHCESHSITLREQRECDSNHHSSPVRGVPLRVFRERPGRVDLRLEGASCAWDLMHVSDVDCTWCRAIAVEHVEVVPGSRLPFPEHGLLELMVAANPGPHPCDEVRLTACFDPDYGAPRWE